MHLLNLFIGFAAFLALTITAAPTNPTIQNIPSVPPFDLSFFNGTTISAKDVAQSPQGAYCGYLTTQAGFFDKMYTSNLCTAASQFEPWFWIDNVGCGLCTTFEGYDCQGKLTWWGGPSKNSVKLPSASGSYFCV